MTTAPTPSGAERLAELIERGPQRQGDALIATTLRRLYDVLDSLLDRAPGFTNRVLGGMCYVICWGRNEILDPADDCLALHPDLLAGLRLLQHQRADFLPRLEREARAAVASTIEAAAARHIAEMRLSADVAAIQRSTPQCFGWDLASGPDTTGYWPLR